MFVERGQSLAENIGAGERNEQHRNRNQDDEQAQAGSTQPLSIIRRTVVPRRHRLRQKPADARRCLRGRVSDP